MILKTYDENNWDIYTIDTITDSFSIVAINSYGRAPPPDQDYFCGGAEYELSYDYFKPTVLSIEYDMSIQVEVDVDGLEAISISEDLATQKMTLQL